MEIIQSQPNWKVKEELLKSDGREEEKHSKNINREKASRRSEREIKIKN